MTANHCECIVANYVVLVHLKSRNLSISTQVCGLPPHSAVKLALPKDSLEFFRRLRLLCEA